MPSANGTSTHLVIVIIIVLCHSPYLPTAAGSLWVEIIVISEIRALNNFQAKISTFSSFDLVPTVIVGQNSLSPVMH